MSAVFALNDVLRIPKSVSTEKINVRSPLGSKIDKPNKNQKSTFLVKMTQFYKCKMHCVNTKKQITFNY